MTGSDLILALAGGGLIGLSASILMLFNGRIAGISGIFSGIVFASGRAERGWRGGFILGLMAAPLLVTALAGPLEIRMTGSVWLLIAAGLLVGFGTRLGSGCTSGHGVCGVSRLSPRSLVATGLFMVSGMATVSLVRLGLGG